MSKQAASGEKKGSEQHAHPAPEAGATGGGKKGKGAVESLPGVCNVTGCKTKATRFNFCEEHFDQFKFGLVKKNGEQVSDYEKKFEHYHAYKARMSAQKAA